jgi:hypothetical protein
MLHGILISSRRQASPAMTIRMDPGVKWIHAAMPESRDTVCACNEVCSHPDDINAAHVPAVSSMGFVRLRRMSNS